MRNAFFHDRYPLQPTIGYNKYKYGLEELYGYAEKLSPKLIRTRLLTRPIMFLNGATDTDRSWSLDESCEGEAQGENRYKRGLLYKHHLGLLVKNSPESQHIWLEIPDEVIIPLRCLITRNLLKH